MATFLGVHDMGSTLSDEKMSGAWEAYKAACQQQGLKAVHTHYNAQAGRAYCLTEANSPEDVQKAHDAAGVPVNEVS